MKRVISLILSIAMVASLCTGLAITGVAIAVGTKFYYGGLNYYVTNGEIPQVDVFSSGTDYTGDIIIPTTVTDGRNEYIVSGIQSEAFKNCIGLTSVTIPYTILKIGNYAFQNCNNIKSVKIEKIGIPSLSSAYIFDGCGEFNIYVPQDYVDAYKNADGWSKYSSKIIAGEQAQFTPSGVTINKQPIEECYGIYNAKTPIIEGNIVKINNIYNNTTQIITIEIPSGKTLIVDAGINCDYSGVNIVGGGTLKGFIKAANLQDLNIENCDVIVENVKGITSKKNINITLTDGKNVSAKKFSFGSGCKINVNGEEITETNIINGKLNGNTIELSSTDVNDGFITIHAAEPAGPNPEELFEYTTDSNSATITGFKQGVAVPAKLVIPDTLGGKPVTSIGEDAFDNITGAYDNFTSVTIGKNVTSIGDYAFAWCLSLTNITIPDSVKTIGDSVFQGSYGLTSIDVGEGNTSYKSIDGVLYSNDEKELICYPVGKSGTSFTIPDSVVTISNCAFFYTQLEDVFIPSNVTNIGDYAFNGCNNLTNITIPDSVESIGGYAFQYCDNLTSVTIGSGVTSIGDSAFQNCSGLTNVTVEATTPTELGELAFCDDEQQLKNLNAIYVPADSVDDYKGATNWANYASIITAMNAEPAGPVEFILNGTEVTISGTDTFKYQTDTNTAEQTSDGNTLTLEKGNYYIIKAGSETFYINYVIKNIEISVDKDTLQGYINTSKNIYNTVSPTDTNLDIVPNDNADGKLYVTQEAYVKFNSDITTAETVYGKTTPEATQFELDKALIDLRKAETEFVKAIRLNNLYLDNGTITNTDVNINVASITNITSQVFGTKLSSATNSRVQTTIVIDGISSTYYSYAAESDIEKYVAADEANKPIPGGTTGGGATGGKYDGMPLELSTNSDKITFTKDDNNFTIKGIYYGLGTKDTILEKDYFGVNLDSSSVFALGNGTHTFRILAISKNGDVNEYYETIEVTGIDTQVVVKQCGVVYINFNGITPGEIKYTQGTDTIYIPVEDKIKLDAAKFDGVSTITFDTTPPVEIKEYSGK